MAVQFYEFGKLPDGRSVTAAKLTNHAGASLTVLDYGATVQALCIPDRDGKPVDVVLGYDTAEEYLKNGDYLGATRAGRKPHRQGGVLPERENLCPGQKRRREPPARRQRGL